MRIDSGRDLLDLYLSQDDGIYPSKSPTPALKLCGCTAQSAEHFDPCEALEYAYRSGSIWACRAPSSWTECCPNLVPDKRAASVPQKQKLSRPDLPRALPSIGKRSYRRDRRRARIISWVGRALRVYDTPASRVILGFDSTITQQEYDDLAERLYADYCRLPANQR